MIDDFLGHPAQQFLRNPEFFNFIFNGFQKCVSICLPNSIVIILLLGGCVLLIYIYVLHSSIQYISFRKQNKDVTSSLVILLRVSFVGVPQMFSTFVIWSISEAESKQLIESLNNNENNFTTYDRLLEIMVCRLVIRP